MSVGSLKNYSDKVVGINETMKAVQNDRAQEVYIAKDADQELIYALEQLCTDKQVVVKYVETMKQLGELAGIQVSATSACILK